MDLRNLRRANIIRNGLWDPHKVLDLTFFGVELAGEVGEACNVIKKLEHERRGLRGPLDTIDHLGEELADVIICTDLCAMSAGVDLAEWVPRRFNATSRKFLFHVYLDGNPDYPINEDK